jgi:putative tributyrin esterase
MMGTLRFNYRSQALGRYTDITVIYPTDNLSYYDETTPKEFHHSMPGQKPRTQYKPGMKFQTVYLIHGGGDDDSLTYRYTNAELFAQRNNVMLVTPNIANSFGIDTKYGVPYSTYLTEELPAVIQALFASSPRREDNFIMGYAMGGNVALGTALMRPDLYHACVDI